MSNIVLTVVTCTFNSQKYLEKNISSVKPQLTSEVEQLFIDGGSSDKTIEIIKSFYAEPLLYIGKDTGISDAMNKGINRANGEYILFLHSDDYLEENTLKKCVEELKSGQSDWYLFGINLVDQNNKMNRTILQNLASFNKIIYGNSLFHQAVIVKKKMFFEFGFFNLQLKYAMDYELWCKYFHLNIKPVVSSLVISNYRIHKQSVSSISAHFALLEEEKIRRRELKGDKRNKILEFMIIVRRVGSCIKKNISVWLQK